jgi:hypothetical protein
MISVAITTITGFLRIPPLRVGRMVWVEACSLSRNSTGGHHQESGDSGDKIDASHMATDFDGEAGTRLHARSPHTS